MQLPLRIVFRHIQPSPALEARVRDRVEQLDRLYDVVSCLVVIEESHRHRRQGSLFNVHVDLEVPQAEIVSSRSPDLRHAHADAHVAVRDAFDAVRRELEDYPRPAAARSSTTRRPPRAGSPAPRRAPRSGDRRAV
jgi:ribosome-associated translation inhibitor RaiA